MRHPKIRNLLLSLLLFPVVAGCTSPTSTPSVQEQNSNSEATQIKVVATFLPMYWFTQAVSGTQAEVDILIPPGSEVHEYQATPANVKAIAQANVLVKNGLGFEEFLETTIKNANNPQLVEINSSQGIETLDDISPVVSPANKPGEEHHDHQNEHMAENPVHHDEEEEHSHEDNSKKGKADAHHHTAGNPHVWIDPVLAKKQVENIRDGLIAADPKNKEIYQRNATAYIQKLEQLDREFKERLQEYPNCTFITFHDAYPYLAQRYGLQQVAVVALPEDSLSPADVQKTVEAVKQYNVKALFGEPGVDNKLLNSLSQDLNLTLYSIDPLESGEEDPEYYFTAMKSNLKTLETACQ